jgi:hypothetical protein
VTSQQSVLTFSVCAQTIGDKFMTRLQSYCRLVGCFELAGSGFFPCKQALAAHTRVLQNVPGSHLRMSKLAKFRAWVHAWDSELVTYKVQDPIYCATNNILF